MVVVGMFVYWRLVFCCFDALASRHVGVLVRWRVGALACWRVRSLHLRIIVLAILVLMAERPNVAKDLRRSDRDVDSTSIGALWFGKRSQAKYKHISTSGRLDFSLVTLVTILFTAFR